MRSESMRAWLVGITDPGTGGGDPAGTPGGSPAGPAGEGGAGTPGGSEGQAAAPAGGPGYPNGVPLSDMDKDERIAYWTRNSRKHEDAAKAAKADLDRMLAERMSEQEKAVMAARDEGRQAALLEASVGAASDIFASALLARDIPEGEIADITRPLDMGSFVVDGRLDVAAVRAYADRVAGPRPPSKPDMGQGPRGSAAATSSGEDIVNRWNL